MAATTKLKPTIFIVGPTASGKSSVALQAAVRFGGEIISADSRAIYKGMSIGTAKPTASEQKAVPHWGIDLIEPGQRFTAYDFKNYANRTIDDIKNRGRIPIIVGGTGLYIDSILFDFTFREVNPALRQKLDLLIVRELQERIIEAGYQMPQNSNNKLHLIRVLETGGQISEKQPLRTGCLVFGIMPPAKEIQSSIDKRVEAMFRVGLIREVTQLLDAYGESFEAVAGIGYKFCISHLRGEINLDKTKELFKKSDWHYARRQRTWLRRHNFIDWSVSAEECYSKISSSLK